MATENELMPFWKAQYLMMNEIEKLEMLEIWLEKIPNSTKVELLDAVIYHIQ